jgi:hypothetical protein
MDQKQRVAELRAKAAEHRVVARHSSDEETATEIFRLAAELERQARKIEQKK